MMAADALSASGRSSEKLSLPVLQSKMKCDPEGYKTELDLIYSQFKSSLELFKQQAALNFTSVSGVGADSTVSKDLGDRAMFLAHVTPCYPDRLSDFPRELADFLRSSVRALPSGLRVHVTQALILMLNRKIVDIAETLALFMELQILGDRVLRKLAFSHVIHSIRRMNQKHKNESKNRALQNILFAILQEEDEAKAKRSLITLCDLHRRKVWFDDRTANAICSACFHSSSRIMIAALSFLLDYEKIEDDEDSDCSSDEDDSATPQQQVVLSKQAIYKANNTGTTSSKKKKKAKLQRVIRSMKRQQRLSSEKNDTSYYSPLNYLKDAQGFVEKLFSRLQTCNERFEVRMMMLKVVARTVGLHRLILLNFYHFLQKYVQPHQRDVTTLLASAVQACHDMVPPDAVEPLFKQIVNQFVHDKSRPEAIAVGLNVVREICLRMPLLMTEDLLQDLVLYRKSHEKAVSSAARSLVTLFRELCPSLLIKKDRGRPTNPTARPKAYGEVTIASDVPGLELLQEDDENEDSGSEVSSSSDGEHQDKEDNDAKEEDACSDEDGRPSEHNSTFGGDESDYQNQLSTDDDEASDDENDPVYSDYSVDDSDGYNDSDDEEDHEELHGSPTTTDENARIKESKGQKRKFADFEEQLNAASKSLRALKKLAGSEKEHPSLEATDRILTDDDFKRIKELKAKKEAKHALTRHGLLKKSSDPKSAPFKVPTSDQLSVKRVDAAILEANIRTKLSKEEKVALARAGREDGDKYKARAAVKQKKVGGLSNKQKQHKKHMPLAALRSQIKKSREEKTRKSKGKGKQFRGKKAWKNK